MKVPGRETRARGDETVDASEAPIMGRSSTFALALSLALTALASDACSCARETLAESSPPAPRW